MKVPYFRAKDRDSDTIVEGFYCSYPLMKTQTDPLVPNEVHSIFTYKDGMMGMINEPVACSIDITTLEFVKWVEVPCIKGDVGIII